MQRLFKTLHRVEDSALLAFVLLLVGLSILQILLRNLNDSGMAWADSALRICVLWVAMFGAMRASRTNNHIAIDLVQRYFSGKPRYFVNLFALLCSAIICTVACYHSIKFIQLERQDGTIAFLSVPVWLCESIIPFALACMALRFLSHALIAAQQKLPAPPFTNSSPDTEGNQP